MKYLYLPLKFEHLWLFMPIILFAIYIPESAAGIYLFGDRPSFQVFFVIVLGLLIYCFTYVFLVYRNYLGNKNWCNLNPRVSLSKYFAVIVLGAYFAIILYAVLTSEKIALWEALRGASANDVALARESLFKTRTGWERLLPYANAVFSTALIPFILATYYLEKKRYRHVIFVLFVASLLVSMEKVLVLKALLPLIVLGCNGYFSMRRVFQFFIFGFMVVSAAFYFSKMGSVDLKSENKKSIQNLMSQQAALFDAEREAKKAIQDLMSQQAELVDTKRVTKKAIKNLMSEQAALLDTERDTKKAIKDIKSQQASLFDRERDAKRSANKMDIVKQLKKIAIERKSIKEQLEFYTIEQPKQIATMRKSIKEQLEFYTIEQPRQIAVMRKQISEQQEEDRKAVKYIEKYNIFGSGQIAFAFNRVFWIPYITAYDWLGFWDKTFSGSYLLGRTSGLISWISNQVQFPMEQEVFKYQFGGGVDSAAANACFLIDAFVNFGWLGVVIYAAIFAALTRIVVVQGNLAMMACYPYFAFQTSMGGMTGVLFSNGMLLLILIASFIKPNLNQEVNAS